MLGLAAAIALGGAYLVLANPVGRNQQAPTYDTAQVTQGNLQVTVSATGPITSPSNVPLSFKSSGILTELDVSVGQPVKAGQVLAREDTSDLEAQLAQAQSTFASQQANQAKVEAGVTPEQVAAARAQVNSAQTTVDSSQRSLDAVAANANST
ncbi:MAG: biotin/lipoyl-binding protein, partial [Chloroflexi bacterium]|nr:biotin/lipoyl-binding protein [Chloroflexota bacterium]